MSESADLKARLGLDAGPFESTLAGVGAKARAGMERIKGYADRQANALVGLAKGFVAPVTALLGISALAGKFSDTIDQARDLERATRATGIASIQTLQQIQLAAKREGIEAEKMESVLRRITRASIEGLEPASKQAKALRALGIESAAFASMKPDEQFLRLADAIASTENPGYALTLLTDLLGRKAAELFPIFRRGSAGVREFANDSRVLSEETVRAFASMKVSAGKFVDSLVGGLANRVVPMMKRVKDAAKDAWEWWDDLLHSESTVSKVTPEDRARWGAAKGEVSQSFAPRPRFIISAGLDDRAKFSLQQLAAMNLDESARARQVLQMENKARRLAAEGRDVEASELFRKVDLLKVGDSSEIERIKELQRESQTQRQKVIELQKKGLGGSAEAQAAADVADATAQDAKRRQEFLEQQFGGNSEQLLARAQALYESSPMQRLSGSDAAKLKKQGEELRGLSRLNASERQGPLDHIKQTGDKQLEELRAILKELQSDTGPVEAPNP